MKDNEERIRSRRVGRRGASAVLRGLTVVSATARAARLASAPSPGQRGSRGILRQAPSHARAHDGCYGPSSRRRGSRGRRNARSRCVRIPPRGQREAAADPQASVSVRERSYTDFAREFEHQLKSQGALLQGGRQDATATIEVTKDFVEQRTLAVSARNIPTDYELRYTVVFEVKGPIRSCWLRRRSPCQRTTVSRRMSCSRRNMKRTFCASRWLGISRPWRCTGSRASNRGWRALVCSFSMPSAASSSCCSWSGTGWISSWWRPIK